MINTSYNLFPMGLLIAKKHFSIKL